MIMWLLAIYQLAWMALKHSKWSLARALMQILTLFAVLGATLGSVAILISPHPSPSADGLNALEWIQENTEREDRILVNAYTPGIFQVMANREAITEGRAPYLQASNLEIALDRLTSAHKFFQNPIHYAILDEQSVDYVIVAPDYAFGSVAFATKAKRMLVSGGASNSAGFAYQDARWWGEAPYLTEVAVFGEIRIFRVVADQFSTDWEAAWNTVDMAPISATIDRTDVILSGHVAWYGCVDLPSQQFPLSDFRDIAYLINSAVFANSLVTEETAVAAWQTHVSDALDGRLDVNYLFFSERSWTALTETQKDILLNGGAATLVDSWASPSNGRYMLFAVN